MRFLLIAGLIFVVLMLVGWVQFSTPDGDPTIRVDTNRVKEDTEAIVDKTQTVIDEVKRDADGARTIQ